MKAKVTKPFKFSPDGNHVVEIEAGSLVEGRAAEVAIAEGFGERVSPERPESVQLPALEEFVARGYAAEGYESAMKSFTEEMEAKGVKVLPAPAPIPSASRDAHGEAPPPAPPAEEPKVEMPREGPPAVVLEAPPLPAKPSKPGKHGKGK